MSKALQLRLHSTKDVYVPIIPSENNLGMYYEDKMFIATFFHFLLDRFSIFMNIHKLILTIKKVVIILSTKLLSQIVEVYKTRFIIHSSNIAFIKVR